MRGKAFLPLLLLLLLGHAWQVADAAPGNCVRGVNDQIRGGMRGSQSVARLPDVPILLNEEYPAISREAIQRAHEATRGKLQKLGVAYSVFRQRTALERVLMRTSMDSSLRLGFLSAGPTQLYRIRARGLPKPGKAHLLELALLHPDLPKYLAYLEARGYALVVDSSLPVSTRGAYFHHPQRIIAIRASARWQTFLHEFRHLEFQLQVLQRYGRDFDRLFRKLPAPPSKDTLVTRAFALARKGLTPASIDETMATEVEFRALRQAGFSALGPRALEVLSYGLKWQISELRAVPKEKRTILQRWTLRRAVAKKIAFKFLQIGHIAAGTEASDVGRLARAGGVVVTAAGAYAIVAALDDDGFLWIEREGKRFVVSLAEFEKRLTEEVIERF